MKVKYDAEADILIFILQGDLPYDAISEQGGVIVSYNEAKEPVSIEFLNASIGIIHHPFTHHIF
jgi:uncharacterized protein YuzE